VLSQEQLITESIQAHVHGLISLAGAIHAPSLSFDCRFLHPRPLSTYVRFGQNRTPSETDFRCLVCSFRGELCCKLAKTGGRFRAEYPFLTLHALLRRSGVNTPCARGVGMIWAPVASVGWSSINFFWPRRALSAGRQEATQAPIIRSALLGHRIGGENEANRSRFPNRD